MPDSILDNFFPWQQVLSALSARVGLALLLVACVRIAIMVGLSLLACSQFKVKRVERSLVSSNFELPPLVLSLLARDSATGMLLSGIGPLLLSMAGTDNVFVTGIILAFLIFALPALIYAYSFETVNRSQASSGLPVAFFTDGIFIVGLTIIVLLLKALNVAGLGVIFGAAGINNFLWITLFFGVVLSGIGFYLGTNLEQIRIPGPPTIPPIGPGPEEVSTTPIHKWLMLQGQQIPLHTGEHKIGRVQNCTVRITEDDEISREHALLRIAQDKVSLGDLNSRNGTYLNGTRVERERSLQDGDVIRIGNTEMTFHQQK